MKKIFSLLCALAMILMAIALPIAAFAEDGAADVIAQTEPFTWQYLATISGAAALTLLVVQFIKAPLDKVWKIPTRFLAYIIALVTLLAATALTTGLNIESVLLAVVNAILAATSAYGMYEITFAKTGA